MKENNFKMVLEQFLRQALTALKQLKLDLISVKES